jgi:Protein of unknown function (DUF3455)
MTLSTSVFALCRALTPRWRMALLIAVLPASVQAQQALPDAIAVPGRSAALTVHAVGAQIYECVADAERKLAWRFREPVATLLVEGRTVGRHYAGPNWELADGSRITGKLAGTAPGRTADDIPWLKLDAATPGTGQFAPVRAIQRINTRGGALSGACETAGMLRPVPYASDYVFLAGG